VTKVRKLPTTRSCAPSCEAMSPTWHCGYWSLRNRAGQSGDWPCVPAHSWKTDGRRINATSSATACGGASSRSMNSSQAIRDPKGLPPCRPTLSGTLLHVCCTGAGSDGRKRPLTCCFTGGRYWVRTSDLFGVNEARYHCANRPLCGAAETVPHARASLLCRACSRRSAANVRFGLSGWPRRLKGLSAEPERAEVVHLPRLSPGPDAGFAHWEQKNP
jgi:hypothetical protein